MKKLYFLFILSFYICSLAYSQIGVKGGINFSSLRNDIERDDIIKLNTYCMLGFHIGGFYDIRLFKNLYLSPQLLFSYEPSKQKYEEDEQHWTQLETKGYYLTLPVMLSYKFPLKKNRNIGIDFGPYISHGLFGRSKDYTEERKYSHFLFGEYGYRDRGDYGLIGGIRYESGNIIVSGHLKYGIPTVDINYYKTITGLLSIGYKIKI